MKRYISVVIAAMLLSSCSTIAGIYTGNEYYYTENGARWSCREPRPYKGGTCKPEREWPTRGLN